MSVNRERSNNELEQPIVWLVRFTPDDAQDIFDLIDDSREHLSQYGDVTADKYLTVDSVLNSILNPPNLDKLRFAVRNKEGVLVGSINLTPDNENHKKAEIGYYLGRGFIGNGYMGAAVGLLVEYAFSDLGYETLFGKVHEDNLASMQVLKKVGFIESGRDGQEIILTRVK